MYCIFNYSYVIVGSDVVGVINEAAGRFLSYFPALVFCLIIVN